MYQLTGEYECKMDVKGRVKLPAGILRQLSGSASLSFVVNRGFDKCLMLYPKSVWDKKTQEVMQLNIYNPKEREFMRYFYRGATEVSTDSAERILIPKSLAEYAALGKEVILFAYIEQIEIWAKDRYAAKLEEEPADFSQLAAEVFGKRSDQATE